jgi:hypothetical protein
MAPMFSGDDDWLSEIDVPAPAAVADTDETISLGRNSAFSRLASIPHTDSELVKSLT